MALFINMIVTPAFALLPLFVREHLGGGAMQLGWVNSALGVGAVAGGVLLSIWGGFQKKIVTSQLGLIGLSLGLFVVGLPPPQSADNDPLRCILGWVCPSCYQWSYKCRSPIHG